MGSIEVECAALEKPPSVIIHRVHDADGPGPEGHDFSGVQTPEFFKAPDSYDDFCRRAEELRPTVGRRFKYAAENSPPPFFCG